MVFFVTSVVFGSIILMAPFIAGIILRQNPPKNINRLYGFRTGITSKNQETWDYAQKLAGSTLVTYSIISMPIYFVVLIINPGFLNNSRIWGEANMSRMYLALAIVLVVFAITIVIVQIKAKRFWKKTID